MVNDNDDEVITKDDWIIKVQGMDILISLVVWLSFHGF